MKKKIGRPTLPKGSARDFQIAIRFNNLEAEKIRRTVSRAGFLTYADWARSTLLGAVNH